MNMVRTNIRFAKSTFGLAMVLWLVLFPDCQATVYYVSPAGSDANTGTSTNSPWQSLSFASSQTYRGGDQLLFEGGGTNVGMITFSSSSLSGNTPGNPVVLSSYGG